MTLHVEVDRMHGGKAPFRLGEGSFGVVYRGTTDEGRKVAIKMQRTAFGDIVEKLGLPKVNARQSKAEQKAIEATQRTHVHHWLNQLAEEMELLRLCRHENVVEQIGTLPCLDEPTFGQCVWIVMEYCNLGTLKAYRRRQPHECIEERQFRPLLRDMTSGIRYLRSIRVLHRDIKPDNVFLSRVGDRIVAKLGDLGLAKRFSNTLEETSSVVGSPLWMAPEILEGQKYTWRADLWSLGVVAFEALFGEMPFDVTGAWRTREVLLKKIYDTCKDVRYALRRNAVWFPLNVSRSMRMLIRELLRLYPNDRIDHEDLYAHPFINLPPGEVFVPADEEVAAPTDQDDNDNDSDNDSDNEDALIETIGSDVAGSRNSSVASSVVMSSSVFETAVSLAESSRSSVDGGGDYVKVEKEEESEQEMEDASQRQGLYNYVYRLFGWGPVRVTATAEESTTVASTSFASNARITAAQCVTSRACREMTLKTLVMPVAPSTPELERMHSTLRRLPYDNDDGEGDDEGVDRKEGGGTPLEDCPEPFQRVLNRFSRVNGAREASDDEEDDDEEDEMRQRSGRGCIDQQLDATLVQLTTAKGVDHDELAQIVVFGACAPPPPSNRFV